MPFVGPQDRGVIGMHQIKLCPMTFAGLEGYGVIGRH
jgi:hypothetical protein